MVASDEVRTFSGRTFIGNFRRGVKRPRRRNSEIFSVRLDLLSIMIFAAGIFVVNVAAATTLNDVDKKSTYNVRFDDDNSLEAGVDENKIVAKFFDATSDDFAATSNDASLKNVRMLVDNDGDQQRQRRLSGESSVMSFYRPTKKVFSSPLDPPAVVLEGKQKRHENDDDVKMSTVEMSSPTFLHDPDHDIGGISHFSGKKHFRDQNYNAKFSC